MHNITCEPIDNTAFDTYMQEIHAGIEIDDYKSILNPGVIETLEFLKKNNFKVALASSSKMHIIQKAIKQCEIASFFDFVISGEQFKESKPNPEIYLTAIKAIGCTPCECIVVEDSSYGIEAGSSAGTYVIAKKDDRFNFDQTKADDQIEQIDEIIDLFNKYESQLL
jgi:HAD superfamily hydrolase (TIGR01509 family)